MQRCFFLRPGCQFPFGRCYLFVFIVASLSGRWSVGCLVTALRGLCPLVPCYARSRPYRDGSSFSTIYAECLFYLLFWNQFRKSYDFFGIDSKKVVSLQGKKVVDYD